MKSSNKQGKDQKRSIKWKKVAVGFTIATCVALPISLLSINWNNLQILYATGSSSVFPLMKKLSDTYANKKTKDEPLINVACEATGSGTGIEKVLDQTASFGNISFSPTTQMINNNPHEKTQWSELQVKTITLGIDGIGLVYKGNFQLDINNHNILDIYNAFAGYQSYTFGQLGVTGEGEQVKLRPYAKTGGTHKSGTADAFLNNSELNISGLSPQTISSLESGNYGKLTKSTKESQPETWKQMLSANQEGTIGYLSSGFILQNKTEIESNGFKIATYNNHELSEATIKSGDYGWRRKLNTVISLKNHNANVKVWINWIFDNYTQPWMLQVYRSVGITQLDSNQINSMKKNNNFWVSDVEIHPLDGGNYQYGAQIGGH